MKNSTGERGNFSSSLQFSSYSCVDVNEHFDRGRSNKRAVSWVAIIKGNQGDQIHIALRSLVVDGKADRNFGGANFS